MEAVYTIRLRYNISARRANELNFESIGNCVLKECRSLSGEVPTGAVASATQIEWMLGCCR
jgi:hypothetical protein